VEVRTPRLGDTAALPEHFESWYYCNGRWNSAMDANAESKTKVLLEVPGLAHSRADEGTLSLRPKARARNDDLISERLAG